MAPAFIRQQPLTCAGHSRPVVDLSYSPLLADGSCLIISACLDGKPMLRDGHTGDWIGTFIGHKGAVWSAALSDDTALAATGSADFTVRLWSALTGDEAHCFTLPHVVKAVSFSHGEGSQLLAGSHDKAVRVFDLNNLDATPRKLLGIKGHPKVAKFLDPENNTVISGGADGCLRLWDLRGSDEPTREIDLGGGITSIERSQCGDILSVTHGRVVSFLDASTLDEVKKFALKYDVDSATLHPKKHRFVAGGHDNWVHVYDYGTGEELETHQGHHGPVHAVAYAPGGADSYATGSDDGTVRIWRTEVAPEDCADGKDAKKADDATETETAITTPVAAAEAEEEGGA